VQREYGGAWESLAFIESSSPGSADVVQAIDRPYPDTSLLTWSDSCDQRIHRSVAYGRHGLDRAAGQLIQAVLCAYPHISFIIRGNRSNHVAGKSSGDSELLDNTVRARAASDTNNTLIYGSYPEVTVVVIVQPRPPDLFREGPHNACGISSYIAKPNTWIVHGNNSRATLTERGYGWSFRE
jgi:hypothetical protein